MQQSYHLLEHDRSEVAATVDIEVLQSRRIVEALGPFWSTVNRQLRSNGVYSVSGSM